MFRRALFRWRPPLVQTRFRSLGVLQPPGRNWKLPIAAFASIAVIAWYERERDNNEKTEKDKELIEDKEQIEQIENQGRKTDHEETDHITEKNDSSSSLSGVTVEQLESSNGTLVAINGAVYDLGLFLPNHPGGAAIIRSYAGKNASTIFNKHHSPDVIKKFLPEDACLGPLKGHLEEEGLSEDDKLKNEMRKKTPLLSRVYNISDFEYIARKILPKDAWAYYSGGSDDEITLRENHYAFARIFFHPKVLLNVDEVDISTEMLGVKVDAPFYCSAAAQARMGHADGELSIARGCGRENIFQMISSSASNTLDEIIDAGEKTSKWFQLYIRNDKQAAVDTIQYCEERGVHAIFVTVDTPELGRREKDMKCRFMEDLSDDEVVARKTSYDDWMYKKEDALSWEDIKRFKSSVNIPVAIKGVQRVEDVLLAIENNVDAVVLSNHGGRQLDFSRAPIEVLADVMHVLREKNLQDKIEVYMDGGVRRGTDVIKALCLGAKGVGLGRPFLYANTTPGENGVVRAIQLLKEEVMLDMKLLGVSSVKELRPELLDLRSLHHRGTHRDLLYDAGYEPLSPPKFLE